ncbi:hypothetical protein DFJ58DRAFT_763550 [Suillus subalutaceus]|uniref:uncharacterized protein n=1 Tax=Suillus subalutaceus TaxID=48586 RepID=UPI001B86E2C9|nr:uncharacterized protein DFJ58DRAFT_763550 [Suillus subalutaceus]KAG1871369.1 hypothetical protein DFJ58DRAFT_763550 [Suillus subalutaceus]
MPRGNNNNRGHGSPRGPGRGQGRGRGRGGRGRGRGRGQDYNNDTPRGNYPHSQNEMDVSVQVWQEPSLNSTPQRGGSTPRRGMGIPRGRGRGRGISDAPRARTGFGYANTPLSKLLDSERPYLKPVIFVPSEEDILQPVAESAVFPECWVGCHVPTADRVARVFSGGTLPPPSSSSSEDGVSDHEDELEELHTAQASTSTRASHAQEVFTGVYNKRNHTVATPPSHPAPEHADVSPKKPNPVSIDAAVSETTAITVHSVTTLEHSTAAMVITKDDEIAIDKPDTFPSSQSPTAPISNEITVSPTCLPEDDTPTFFVDTEPTKPFTHRSSSDVVLFDRTLIVYVAPHPRSGQVSPNVPRVRLPSRSVLTGTTNPMQTYPGPVAHEDTIENKSLPVPSEAPQFSSVSFDFATPSPKKQSRQRPIFTPGDRSKARMQARKQDARVARKRAKRQAMFGSFGAILSEARLRDADERGAQETMPAPVNDGVDEVSIGLGGMDLDPDLEPDLEAMKGFVQSMSAEGSRHRTIDEIQDEEEDDGSDSHGSYNDTSDEEDKEENAVFEVEEEMLIAESEGGRPHEASRSDDSDEADDSSDDELSPGANFQARLRRVREKSRSAKPATAAAGSDSEEESDAPFPRWNRGDSDDDYIARIEDMLEMHSGTTGKDRKLRNKLFRAIQNGQFDHIDDYEELDGSFSYQPAKGKKDKMKELPAELQEMWEKDRAKKAERKRARKEARLLDAVDPISPKKGGKKGRKAMRAAARLDPRELSEIQNAIEDMVTLEKQIRRFISDTSGKNNMVLPPMNKASRKEVHELANSFNLKSQSKGKGKGRYTTLIKSTNMRAIDERKVKSVMKKHGGRFDTVPRHKDGDEVGKVCCSKDRRETNVGFRMLASMGWAEGDRIGGDASTGIDAPLTAIIKNTKLGLGATR